MAECHGHHGKMKKRAWIIVLVLALVAGIGFNVWRSRRPLDLSNDEAPFNTIQLPIKKVRGTFLMDGGSVWVMVEDSRDVSHGFLFPIDNTTNTYPTARHDMSHYSDVGVELTDPSRAKEIVLRWMEQEPDPDAYLEMAEDFLSGRAHSDLGNLLIGIRETVRDLFR